MRKLTFFSLLLLGAAVTSSARADESCEESQALDKYQFLRRLSLDLRGQLPSIDEYDALDALDDVPTSTIQAYVSSDAFRQVMRDYHEAMFWPNITSVKLFNTNATLSNVDKTNGNQQMYAYRYAAVNRAKLYRGDQNAWCGDFQQTHFDPAYPGQYRPDPNYIQTDGSGNKQEGWRMVAPYWDPGNPIPVCAFDAQESVTAKDTKGNDTTCNTLAGDLVAGCGAGKSLAYVAGTGVDVAVKAALREQLGQSVDDVTAHGHPYTDLMLSHKAYENGTLAFWRANLAPKVSGSTSWTVPDPGESVPDKAWDDTTWTEVDLGSMHAGVLSLPGYLLRFQTNRGRANRFRINFLCEYFVPPATLDPAPGCDPLTNDLTQRCNCQYCHQTLEPLAASFADFAEAGTTLMTDPTMFPEQNAKCVSDNPSAFCARFYVTESDAHRAGYLLPRQWMDLHPEYEQSMNGGPLALAQSVIDDGSFAECTVKKLFSFFVKRDPQLDGSAFDEQATIDQLAADFKASNYDLATLVTEIVSLKQYRRTR